MKSEDSDNLFDELIHRALGRDNVPFDFQAWKEKRTHEIIEFQSEGRNHKSEPMALAARRGNMTRTLRIAAAAAIFIGVCLDLPHLGHRSSQSGAFAQTLEQIEKAASVSWKITFYDEVTSKDGKRTWIATETREHAYKVPGLYRDVSFDPSGQIHHWTVTDTINMKEIGVNPNNRIATIRELATATQDRRGPFAWVMEELKKQDLQWVATRQTPAGPVNVFRRSFWDESSNAPWSYDFWIDAQSKRLVALYVPGADIYDPETDPARSRSPEEAWSAMRIMCSAQYDIDFAAVMDESLFSFEPPAGYAIDTEQRAQVTEADMIEYLGILADYNGQVFPDQPYSVGSDKLNAIGDKAKEDRTPAEQRLLDTVDHYKMASLNMMPTSHFVEDHAVKDSFRYLGKGVRLGDKNHIVCWYKLKDSGTYRVVYGDLSVKDVASEELPLPVEP
jgi:hypothetical protein